MPKKMMLFLTAFLLFAASGYAAEKIKVLSLPFDIYSQEEQSGLNNRIPEIISRHLEKEGLEAVAYDKMMQEKGIDLKDERFGSKPETELRSLGTENSADYVLWGSITVIENDFSLDVKLLSVLDGEMKPPVFMEGKMEALLKTLETVSKKLNSQILNKVIVTDIQVKGLKRIEEDAIKRKIKTKPGDYFDRKQISDDIKKIYSMGYFDDIKVSAEKAPNGKILIFDVVENGVIRDIHVTGNRLFDDEEIMKNLTIKSGSVINVFTIQNNIRRLESLYKDKNYHNVKIVHTITPVGENRADITFDIVEGNKVSITKISFEGNSAYNEDDLKDEMETSEKGFWSFITNSGDLKQEDLNQDIQKLTSFYLNNGYIDAKVSDPEITFKDDGIYINIKLEEGNRYEVGSVDVAGDLIKPKDELLKELDIIKQQFYNREVLRNDVLKLTDVYGNDGYAYADISPKIDKKENEKKVDIVYDIVKNNQVYFEKIEIAGNTKTRDKVIRREIKVNEQGLYSGTDLKASVRSLYRLEYFEDVKVDTVKGSDDDKMILKINVKEKPTGTFSFGGGYSSVENLFVVGSVSQRNLFGRGQTLQLQAELGSETKRYTLSFTEPWLYDIPLSAGFDIYNWEYDYDDYDKNSTGGRLRFGYPIFEFTKVYWSYSYDQSKFEDIDRQQASYWVRRMADGYSTTSSVTGSIRYDSRDRLFNPTEGSDHSITIEHAGDILGGDIGFTKYIAETGWYFPVIGKLVTFLHGRAGYMQEESGEKYPWERFNLGGIKSLRGFDWEDLSPKEWDEENQTYAEIGGNKFVQFNFELLYPVIPEAGVIGVAFFDTGDVYDNNEDIDFGDLRESAGLGIRWYSPVGPIRIEYGFVLDRQEGESRGRWEFTMGGAF